MVDSCYSYAVRRHALPHYRVYRCRVPQAERLFQTATENLNACPAVVCRHHALSHTPRKAARLFECFASGISRMVESIKVAGAVACSAQRAVWCGKCGSVTEEIEKEERSVGDGAAVFPPRRYQLRICRRVMPLQCRRKGYVLMNGAGNAGAHREWQRYVAAQARHARQRTPLGECIPRHEAIIALPLGRS